MLIAHSKTLKTIKRKRLNYKTVAMAMLCASSSISPIATSATAASKGEVKRTPIFKTDQPVTIDALASERVWQSVEWREVDQVLIGENLQAEDFSGRYKLLWDSSALYMLIEIIDDVLIDTHPDPLISYWDDDCVEIFIDEDGSGGNHRFNYNAFAYHIGLDRNVSDMGPLSASEEKVTEQEKAANNGSVIQTYNDHVQSQWTRSPATQVITWELKISLFDDTFLPNSGAKPVTLADNKEIGFMLAYCDADKAINGLSSREHFIGSYPIEAKNGDKNLGYIDASVFEPMVLKDTERLSHQRQVD